MSNIEMGSKNNYKRMDSELGEDDNESLNVQGKDIANSTRRYVMACAFFASVNSVLLGYGKKLMHILTLLILKLVVYKQSRTIN